MVSIETTYIKIRLDIYGFYADYLDIIKVLNTINFNKKKIIICFIGTEKKAITQILVL